MAFPREDRSAAAEITPNTPPRTVALSLGAVNNNNTISNANTGASEDSYRPPLVNVYTRRHKTKPSSSNQARSTEAVVEPEPAKVAPDSPQWTELNFEAADPESFVGLTCKVFWPDDIEWYYGQVVKYDSKTKKHQLNYDDGDIEELILSEERIRFLVPKNP